MRVKMRAAVLVVPAVVATLALGSPSTVAQDAFYKGKTITMVVGYSPGGGYDTYARTLTRYLGRNVPGSPNVIVQNMPGAASLAAVRYVYAVAPKDGLVIAAFNPGLITDSMTNPEQIKLKFSDFGWIGSITRDFRVCYAWKDTGITSIKELEGGRQFIIGATGLSSSNYVNGAMLRNLLGLKVKQVLGFPGSNELRLAIERGELEGDCGSWSSIHEEWIQNKRINTLVSFSPGRTPDMPEGVPFAGDLIKDPEKKQILDILIAAGETGRPYVVAKEVPEARLKTLRAAFMATMADKEFLAEADKQGLPVNPIDGDAAAKLVAQIYTAPADIIAKAKEAMK